MLQSRGDPVHHVNARRTIFLMIGFGQMPCQCTPGTTCAENECFNPVAPVIGRQEMLQRETRSPRVDRATMETAVAFEDAADFADRARERIEDVKLIGARRA